MARKIIQNTILCIFVATILYIVARLYIINDDAADTWKVFVGCLFVSSVVLLAINCLLKYMGEIMYLRSPLSKIDKMSGEEFELYLKHRFRKLGYKVEITRATGDYGADLFCFNKKETIVVQAKRYDANVGTKAVQEIVGAREYYEADLCVVVTNSYFTVNALNLAEANGVVLIDRDDLLNFNFERVHRVV